MIDERKQQAVAYLLEEMSPDEIADFKVELRQDGELRHLVQSLRPVVGKLGSLPDEAWTEADPPPLRLPLDGASAEREAPGASSARTAQARHREWFQTGWFRSSAALATACLLLGVGVFVGSSLNGNAGAPSPEVTRTVQLSRLGEAPPGATGKVELATSRSDAANLNVRGLKPTGKREFYELWLMDEDGRLVALSSFRVKPDGDRSIRVALPVNPSTYQYFDVSIQPDNGSPEHSNRSVLRGPSVS